MGTSKSFTTPSGGAWTSVKSDISDYVADRRNITAPQIIAGTIRALKGLGVPASGRATGSAAERSAGRSGGGGGGGAGGGGGGGSRAVGRATSGLAGFGTAFQGGGLDAALQFLGLSELEGHPASEVIARIADHLAEGNDPTQYELLNDALRSALIEAAALQEAGAYVDLEAALQAYLDANGVEGLIQLFLSQYVFDRVWMAIENHAELKSQGESTVQALSIAVGNTCRSDVEALIAEQKEAGQFENVDWFGKAGADLGNALVAELESRLRNA
jgi:hypothetical protein